jgi:hypothetical protein
MHHLSLTAWIGVAPFVVDPKGTFGPDANSVFSGIPPILATVNKKLNVAGTKEDGFLLENDGINKITPEIFADKMNKMMAVRFALGVFTAYANF